MQKLIDKASILIEALPYIRAFYGKTIVIKYGGSAMMKESLKRDFASDVVLLKYIGINPIVVHGGGPQIEEVLKRLGRRDKPVFIDGMRVTDAETMEVVEMVLVGRINKELVSLINQMGGAAVGLSGKDGGLIRARMMSKRLGLVGEVERVNPEILGSLLIGSEANLFIPVIAPVGVDAGGVTLNVNADTVAAKVAAATKAAKLVYLSDVEGVMDEDGRLISSLKAREARALIKRGVITGGMTPKVRCCLIALKEGVGKTHIIDGRIRHAILLEIFTKKGIGTEILT